MIRSRFLTAFTLMIGLCLAPTLALSQDLAPLQDRISRLEQSILDLQRFVHQGKGLSSERATAGALPTATPSATGATGTTAKLNALEEEVRALTNRVEEVNFLVRRLDDRMNKLVDDVDFRLTAIERNLASGGGGGGNDASTQGAGPQTLGTVSQEAVDRVPGGNATTPTTPAVTVAPVQAAAVANVPTEALQGDPKTRYNAAFGLLRAKRFGEAETAFVQFINDHPQHELAGNAQYWLGETYYVQQDYQRAASSFLEGYKKYRSSSKAPDNLLKLAMTLSLLEQKPDACAVFDELKARYPNASRSITRRAASERQKTGC